MAPQARRVGAYAKLLANYAQDDALIAAGEKAELLFVRGLSFCATSDSDGFITESQLIRYVGAGMRDVKSRANSLVREGVWQRVEGGYVVRSWLKIHESSAEKGRKLKADRERKRAEGDTPQLPLPDGIQADSEPDSGRNTGPTPSGAPPDSLSLNRAVVLRTTSHDTTGQSSAPIPPPTAQTIVAEWIDHAPKRPPDRVIGPVAKSVGEMLAEGIDPDDVRRGVNAWMTKGLHPSTLPSVVNEVMNAQGRAPRRTTDNRVQDGLALAQRLAGSQEPAQRQIGTRP